MRGMRFPAAALAALLLGLAGTASAQGWRPYAADSIREARKSSPEQRLERKFLQQAASHQRFQLEAAKLAMDRSSSAPVRQLAAALVNHANNTQPEILHLLNARGMAMPIQSNDEARTLKMLAKLQGANFDRVFVGEVGYRASSVDAAQYEKIASVTKDAQLLAWVQRHLPTVRYHVQLAERAMPVGTRMATTAPQRPRTDVMGAAGAP